MDYNWDWSIIERYWKALGYGAMNSLLISGLSIIIGTILGFLLLYVITFPRYRLIKTVLIWITEILLAVPLLVLLIWFYYCIPILTGLNLTAFQTCVIAMSISLAPFVSETIRSGLDSIPKGYTDAGIALGLKKRTIVKKILLPQAFREMLPALLTQYISLLKLSSLASFIAVNELLHSANNIIAITYRPLEVFTIVAVIYMIIVIPISRLVRMYETNEGLTKQ